MNVDRRKKALIAAAAGTVCLFAALGWMFRENIAAFAAHAANEDTHPVVFVALFCVLPMIGFPITAFLVILGVKFGTLPGLLIMAAGIPLHLAVAFLLANSFLRRRLERLFARTDYGLPEVPRNRAGWFSFGFMAVPGLSYTLKNYILALSGVPFRWFFLSGFLVQGAMGVPFVVAGDAVAEKSLWMLGAVLLLLPVYAAVYKLRKRHARKAS